MLLYAVGFPLCRMDSIGGTIGVPTKNQAVRLKALLSCGSSTIASEPPPDGVGRLVFWKARVAPEKIPLSP